MTIPIADGRPHRPGWQIDLVLGLMIFVFAVAVRIPNLSTIPQVTDESEEVESAIRIVKEGQRPVVAVDSYDGPLFVYLLSLVFRLTGFHHAIPRGFVLVVGALTVVATYLLAREVARGDRRVALLSAAALAVNPHHVVFTSHLAFSNSTTPFFTTVAVWLYHRATRLERPGLLVAAGGVFGLALQTHPSALALAPGLALDFLLGRQTRTWLRRVAPYLALTAALGAYAPVLYHNAKTDWGSLHVAERRTYAFEASPSLVKGFERTGPLLSIVGKMGTGSLQKRPRGSAMVILFCAAAAAALSAQARRGERLMLYLVAGSVLFFSAFSRYYENPVAARYYMALLPLLFTACADGIVSIADTFPSRALGRVWIGTAAAIVLLVPLANLRHHYCEVYAAGTDNGSLLEIVATLAENRMVPVVLDRELEKLHNRFGGSVFRGLGYYLDLEERPFVSASLRRPADVERLKAFMAAHPTGYLVAFADAGRRLALGTALQSVINARFPCENCDVSQDYVLFSWGPEQSR